MKEISVNKRDFRSAKNTPKMPKIWFLAFLGYFWHYELSFWQITDVGLLESL